MWDRTGSRAWCIRLGFLKDDWFQQKRPFVMTDLGTRRATGLVHQPDIRELSSRRCSEPPLRAGEVYSSIPLKENQARRHRRTHGSLDEQQWRCRREVGLRDCGRAAREAHWGYSSTGNMPPGAVVVNLIGNAGRCETGNKWSAGNPHWKVRVADLK